jgi:SAM-dependent methyltransferase
MLNKNMLRSVSYNGINVYYVPHLDGGGTSFGQDFVPVVREHFKKLGRVCEFCSGPGFIGFLLLANGLCDSLCLVDVNKDAIEACKETIKRNGLAKKAAAYVSDGLGRVPKSEKWDLVVSNPPHFYGTDEEYGMDVIAIDPKWKIHEQFYRNISKFLNPGGSILFVENGVGSTSAQWRELIERNSLKYIKSFTYKGEKRSDSKIPMVFANRFFESIRDGSILSNGPKFYIHNFKKLVRSAYKQSKFYFVWSKK